MAKKSIPTTVQAWLRDSAEMIANVGITSALLDAEIILAHTVRKPHLATRARRRIIERARTRNRQRPPATAPRPHLNIAYIVGHKKFYGRLFKVSPSVLIPRPESEAIITLLKQYGPSGGRLIDVGTGSGCLGITAKLELPDLEVTLADNSRFGF